MLDEMISVHDAFQLEIKQHIPFPPDGGDSRYGVETFIFLPSTLNINQSTYPTSHFYRGLKNYIRLQVPAIPANKLVGPGSLLETVRQGLSGLPEEYDDELTHEMQTAIAQHEQQTKLFCLSLRRALRASCTDIKKRYDQDITPTRCHNFVAEAKNIMETVWSLTPPEGKATPDHIPAAQEFCSTVTRYYTLQLIRFLDAGNQDANSSAKTALLNFVHMDMQKRAEYGGFVQVQEHCDNALFVSRWNALKKYINSALFLEIHNKREGAFLQHVAYSLAAALAMIFATVIAFAWQIQYGAVSTPLFVALVVSYIFKDRLKDILREYMSELFRRHVFDRRQTIYQNKESLGRCRERFNFMETRHLPSDIMALRRLTGSDLPFFVPTEDIMCHYKQIFVRPQRYSYDDNLGLVDITRLDLHEIGRNMDATREELLLLDGDTCKTVFGVKTYSIHLIRRQFYEGVYTSSVFQLLIDHKGVRRIEKLYPAAGMPPV